MSMHARELRRAKNVLPTYLCHLLVVRSIPVDGDDGEKKKVGFVGKRSVFLVGEIASERAVELLS